MNDVSRKLRVGGVGGMVGLAVNRAARQTRTEPTTGRVHLITTRRFGLALNSGRRLTDFYVVLVPLHYMRPWSATILPPQDVA